MTEEKSSIDRLIENAENYIKTKQELMKLAALEKSSAIIAKAVAALIVFAFLFFFFVFGSIALAWWIGEMYGRTSTGFIAVGGLYLIIGLLLYANRKKWIEIPLINSFIRSFFEKEHE